MLPGFLKGYRPLPHHFARLALLSLLVLGSGVTFTAAAQQPYPERPLRFIVPSAAGGAADINARLLAAELAKLMGQQIVVDNRPGAAGSIGMELIARAVADGYTIGCGTSAALAINRSLL